MTYIIRHLQLSYFFHCLAFVVCTSVALALASGLLTQAHAGDGVSPATVDGPYHIGLDFIDSTIDPAPEAYYPCIEELPSSCNGFAQFEITTPGNNFVTQGGLAGWSEEDARRGVALAVDDVFRDLETNDPNTRARINIYVGPAPTELVGQRLNVVLGQVSNSNYPTTLLGSPGGQYNDPLMNDQIAAVTYINNVDALGDTYVTYDTPEDVFNAIAGTAAHEIGHVFGISHVETLPGDTEPYPLVSSEADGLPTSARLTARRYSTIRPAGTSNAERVYLNAGTVPIGDINLDETVDASDVGTSFSNWGMVDRLYNEGDVTGDHTIDAADVGVMFGNWTGDPGPAAPGTANAEYNPATGEIVVSVNDVLNWYIELVGADVMTGPDSPSPPLPLGRGLVTDNDTRIGETAFSLFSYTDAHLGAVAASGLANDGSLKIFWNASLGGVQQQALVTFIPEPTTIALAALGLAGLLSMRRRRVA